MRFADKVAVVAGASGGLGKGVATALAAEGARVVIWGTNQARLEHARHEIASQGGSVSAMQVDIRDYEQVSASVGDVLAAHGRLDIMVPTVGGGTFRSFIDTSPEQMKSEFEYNFTIVFNCFHAALRPMVERQYGRLLCFLSTTGGTPGLSIYGMSKAACRSLIESIAAEHIKDRITVNGLLPGFVATPFTKRSFADPDGAERLERIAAGQPLGLNTVENVARTALNLLADDRCTGQVLQLR
jgi:NAD(P)-dependent dehydrogenase (short-subunit alcohol dehydrogenase family)